jgi:spore coat polysaccharide biosynthesis predicted glycosyltransferase SpsG
VSTSSSTTYELLALGTPIISVPVADNQEPIARSLRERDAASVLEQGVEKKEFKNSIQTYVSTPKLRRAYRNLGQQLVDGHGTERICGEILSIAENKT